ncbi:MAG: hypothetical protein WCG31_06970 [Deltaproteobacteria bacterium]
MKKMLSVLFVIIVVAFSLLFLCRCSDSGNSELDTVSKSAMSRSATALQALVADDSISSCMQDTGSCSCPGGGELVSVIPESLASGNCKDSSNNNFNGSVTVSGDTNNGTFSMFGECTDVTTSNLAFKPYCAGTIVGTCRGVTVACELFEPDDEKERCECHFES